MGPVVVCHGLVDDADEEPDEIDQGPGKREPHEVQAGELGGESAFYSVDHSSMATI